MPSSTKLVLQRRAAHLGRRSASVARDPPRPQVVQAIRRRLPPGSDPAALLFTGPGGGPGQLGSPRVKKGTRTVVSRNNFRRTYRGALAKLTRPATARAAADRRPRPEGAPRPRTWQAAAPRTWAAARPPPHQPATPRVGRPGRCLGHWEGDWCLAGGPARLGPWWNAAAAMWGCSRCLRGSPPSACARH
jgi:hypothetical protein